MAQPYVGEIRMFAGNFAPVGWMLCDGQQLSISENETLFQLIGTMYGGDGEETFNLPNLQSRIPLHMGNGPDGINYPISQMAGTEQETLTVQQIPIHTHALTASLTVSQEADPSGNVLAQSTLADMYISDFPADAMANNTATPAGGSQPHENTQPFLCINYIISLFGLFPQPT